MLLAVVVVVAFLATICLVLLMVYWLRPETLKLKATLTKWMSFDLEMVGPKHRSSGRKQPRRLTRNDEP